MEKILISGCLLGQKVRYHGGDAFCDDLIIKKWQQEDRLIAICPEVSAGLSVPRESSEIVGGTGIDVLRKSAKVLSHTGFDKTEAFIKGAKHALTVALKYNIKIAILKKNSPSCGNTTVYDGTFSGTVTAGSGVTAALLKENGMRVFNDDQLHEALEYLIALEAY
ncbi:MAG: DUF523 domain-containing protein [Gammaproteobacteria bacterium CG_4_10_14_0_8_um_filter_38_16]|nr:MAG: DUF523 domain-containing protein [Gammaproteobacteria bacterium CG_4_10_14_0_8_um_filter_38_16]PJA03757.1 MAG: DUF523 domain-containing protein [Gammaproteobacteria bacterium CG_4_10_14_0_2_um_filter_38_22]PJB10648.1 MAG: DUF523 domain-containing protein [Gammaproteobacteria bacterium CG_4_9_14_3_um_filter_38_9]